MHTSEDDRIVSSLLVASRALVAVAARSLADAPDDVGLGFKTATCRTDEVLRFPQNQTRNPAVKAGTNMAVSTVGHGGLARRIARGRIRTLAVPLAAVLSVPLVALAVPAVTSSTTASAATPSTALPFDMPSTSTLRSAKKLVFTHYWPPLPISMSRSCNW